MTPRKSPYMNFLLLLSCVSEPRRIVFSCVILVTAVAASVVYAGVSRSRGLFALSDGTPPDREHPFFLSVNPDRTAGQGS